MKPGRKPKPHTVKTWRVCLNAARALKQLGAHHTHMTETAIVETAILEKAARDLPQPSEDWTESRAGVWESSYGRVDRRSHAGTGKEWFVWKVVVDGQRIAAGREGSRLAAMEKAEEAEREHKSEVKG